MGKTIPYIKRALTLAGLILVLIFLSRLLLGSWTCPFKYATGLPCGGCGMLRAADALLHAEFAAAFSSHPLIYLLVFYFIYYGAGYISGRLNKINHKLNLIIVTSTFIIFAVLRIVFILSGSY